MEKLLKSKAKVRFQDCDPFNHLNNSKYLDYMMNAREDHLLEYYNLDIVKHIKDTGNGWIIASNQISYIRPASLHEVVLIETKLINYTPKSLLVEMQMWDENKEHLKSIYWSKLVYFDTKTLQTKRHSPDFINLFEKVVIPVEQVNFDERCFHIVRNLRLVKATNN